jgi:cytochrome c553
LIRRFLIAVLSMVICSSCAFAASKPNGEAMFKKRCTSCHGEKGEKHVAGKTAQISALSKEVIAQALKDYRSGKRSQHGMGQVMKSEVLKNTDTEIEALASYIVTLNKKD